MKEYFRDLREIKQQKGYDNFSNNIDFLNKIGAELINPAGSTYRYGDWDIYSTRNRCRNFKTGEMIQLNKLKKIIKEKENELTRS